MRNSVLYSTLIAIISLLIISCDNNGSTSNRVSALTENDFAKNPTLSANPREGVVVMFTEPTSASDEDNLTGELGFYVFIYKYTETINHTICWEDDNSDAEHFMTLTNSEGTEILRVEVNGECVTEVKEIGEYEVKIFHDNSSDTVHPIFIRPTQDETAAAKGVGNDKGILEELTGYLRVILNNFDLAQSTNAQTVDDNVSTLLSTNSCELCDLEGADLSSQSLTSADLKGADLNDAVLSDAVLSDADLSFSDANSADFLLADLSDASLISANLTQANLELATMSGTDFNEAVLIEANLSGSNLSDANLSETDLTDATFKDATLTGANLDDAVLSNTTFDGATWTDGSCTCDSGSTDECSGC